MKILKYDAVIIGAGQAGVPLAKELAEFGWHTALVESVHVGGTCVNEGCTPSKTLAASARVGYLARRAGEYGIVTGDVSVDMAAVYRRKQAIVDSWRDGSQKQLESTPNLDLLMGEAAFTGPHRLGVHMQDGATMHVESARIFINTGCRPAVPALPGLESVPHLDSTTIMDLQSVPEHLLILGGGYVAAEFAQMFRRFGSRVTLIQNRDRLLPREDADVAEALAGILREDGIALHLSASTLSVTHGPGSIVVAEVKQASGTTRIDCSHLLVATGRVPNTERLDLAAAGIDVDEGGFIPVNDRLETAAGGVYALGDVKGGPAFTHISYDDFRIVRDNLLRGGSRTTRDRLVPYTVFTDPELGRVGLSEREAVEQGVKALVYSMPMRYVGRALETGEARGLLKVIVDADEDRILGCAVLGIAGGEVMSVLQMAMLGGVTASQLHDAVFAHPVVAEAFNNLLMPGGGRPPAG